MAAASLGAGKAPRASCAACSKKYWIEKLDGEKVVARKKGFTATACTAAVAAASETPQFQLLQTGEKVAEAGNQKCVKGEGQARRAALIPRLSAA